MEHSRCHPEAWGWPKDLNVNIASRIASVLEVGVEVLRFAQDDTGVFAALCTEGETLAPFSPASLYDISRRQFGETG